MPCLIEVKIDLNEPLKAPAQLLTSRRAPSMSEAVKRIGDMAKAEEDHDQRMGLNLVKKPFLMIVGCMNIQADGLCGGLTDSL
ncbi:hypothetical protein CW700_02425 [Candidatus Bathyarchaeota archaeon]|nr:MAG: hypothetical protein CW700_02425 [Candidatus Bathyarchaeota archaeon]